MKGRIKYYIALLLILITYSVVSIFVVRTVKDNPLSIDIPSNLLNEDANELVTDDIYYVVNVVDGDTIKVEDFKGDIFTVRLIGIDTPETVHPSRQTECFGKEASDKLNELLEDAEVIMEKDVSETDRYGRLLRYIWKDEVFINDFMVREGYAFVSTFPPDVQYEQLFRDAQEEAWEMKKGLWNESVCSYIFSR